MLLNIFDIVETSIDDSKNQVDTVITVLNHKAVIPNSSFFVAHVSWFLKEYAPYLEEHVAVDVQQSTGLVISVLANFMVHKQQQQQQQRDKGVAQPPCVCVSYWC